MRKTLEVLLFLFIGLSVNAESESKLIKSSLFENYSVSNGLADEKIHCVFQDSKGWIWLGTDYGVLRFDGYQFSSLEHSSSASQLLSNALIRVIYEDSKENIWIGTDFQGLFKYNRQQNTLQQFKDKGFSHNSVWDIIEDSRQKLWLGTEGGLNYFNPETKEIEQTFTTANSSVIPGNWVRKLYLDSDSNLWVGTNKGIVVLNSGFKLVNTYLVGPHYKERENEVWEIYKDLSGTLWIGTYLGGLLKLNKTNGILNPVELDSDNNRSITVRTIIQDGYGNIWFGTRGGLYKMNLLTNKITLYLSERYNNFSLIHNSVLDLFTDKKGDLWVGTRNGLSFLNFDKQAFGYLVESEGEQQTLNNGEVYVFWEDIQERLWIGTESGGVNIFDTQHDKISYLTVDNGLSSNCVKAISPGNNGTILIGTYLGGLNVYQPDTRKVIQYKHNPNDTTSICDNEVWAVFKDSKKRIWVGTSKGLDLFDPEKKVFYHYGPRYNLSWVSMIYEDNQNNLWVFSPDVERMMQIYSDGTFRLHNYQSRALCEDNKGNYWLASLGQGLIKLDRSGNELTKFTTEDGLCSNVLNGIINVNNQFLWLSTNNGISRFNLETGEFKNYFSSDGLLNNKFNYGAFYKTSKNILAFGGKNGVDFVYLDKINQNTYIPPVVLTGFKLFNKKVEISPSGILNNHISETKSITLAHHQNMFTFDFAALNYANSNKNKYKYMLEGFDKEWNDIGNSRMATYTNIQHGEYIFRVQGSNNDNLFNQVGAELAITLLPPFWNTWWFRMLAILFLVYLFYMIFSMIRNREVLKQQLIFERQTAHKIQEVDRLKHQFFMNISHEIRTPLSLISGPIEKLLNHSFDDDVVVRNLKIIQRNSNNLKRLINQLLDYRKLETGNLKLDLRKGNIRTFAEEIFESFRMNAEEKEINFEFNAFQPSIFMWFDADKVEKILNNIISNAIKYTPNKGSISASISLIFKGDMEEPNLLIPPLDIENVASKKFVKIKIIDTGIGIAPENLSKIFDRFRQINSNDGNQTQGSGIGLALTKELVKMHNGHLKVRSKLGSGSRFSVYLPFDNHDIIPEDEVIQNGLESDYNKNERYAGKKDRLMALVVDDNPDLREFIVAHFEPEYQVLEAKNGKEAWEISLDRIPDVIIADVMMPVMNGNELCKKLKRDERTSHIPVIILSALSSSENQLQGIDAGADDYLTKPFDVGLLKAKVDNLLSIRKALRERYSKEMVLKPKDIILASPDEKFLKRLIALIEKNIAKELLDVEFLSQNLDVSRTQLYRKIGALTDMTPKEFVKDIRLKRAAQLIVQNKLNISEVAYDVGFNDVSYFRKCFREKFGMSASEYKKSTKH
ncbi:MAG: two-component regulator propeller domain-containing protein [Salinivirgaceae bacterium]